MPTSPGLRIGRILGIPIYVHASWMIIFVLITMSLAVQFTQEHPQWTSVQHWSVGIATSLLFFASVLFHELSHSMVARIYKIRVISITLFVFGGVARIGREPAKATQEFNIAIAGPLASLFLAFGFYSLTLFFPYAEMTGALAVWLWQTNAALALFNLLPGFPLDGGRIFRAIVWGVTKDFSRATKIAGTSGNERQNCGLRNDSFRRWVCHARAMDFRFVARVYRLVLAERRAGKRGASRHSRSAQRVARC